jgi:hypothetical protein
MDPNIEGSKKIALPCIVLASQQGNYVNYFLKLEMSFITKNTENIF